MNSDFEADVMAVRRSTTLPAILDVICQVTGMGCATVARVTADRWIECRVLDHAGFGLAHESELPLKTPRDEAHASRSEIAIDDILVDPGRANYSVPSVTGLRSYISVPIRLAGGSLFGVLCAFDAKPAHLRGSPYVGMFRLFAQLIALDIDQRRAVKETHSQLAKSREIAELREQFIAVLGHDLRNPLAAFQAGTQLLRSEPQSSNGEFIVNQLEATARCMTGLVNNMLNLAKGATRGRPHDLPGRGAIS